MLERKLQIQGCIVVVLFYWKVLMNSTGLTLGPGTTKMPGSLRAHPTHGCCIRNGEFGVAQIPAAVLGGQFTPTSLEMR